MPRSFNLSAIKLTGLSIKDPRVALRAVIGVLLAANLAAAAIAFKPFGGSASDLRRQQEALGSQLATLDAHVATARRIVTKVETARKEGDEFLAKYVMERRTMSSSIAEELNRMAKDAGVRQLPEQNGLEDIEGSDTLKMATITAGCEGSYANLKKFVEMIDKSQRFLIIESMSVVSPQQLTPQQQQQQSGQNVNVSLKLDTFVRETSGVTP
jgi:type IV pilus assembly protein PilO